jgi:hypothetical protein
MARGVDHTRKVLYFVSDDNLPTGPPSFDDKYIESGASSVNGGRKARGASTEDHKFTFFHSRSPY